MGLHSAFFVAQDRQWMHACMQIHLPVVRTWSTKCGMFECKIEYSISTRPAVDACLHANPFAGRKNMEHEVRNVRV